MGVQQQWDGPIGTDRARPMLQIAAPAYGQPYVQQYYPGAEQQQDTYMGHPHPWQQPGVFDKLQRSFAVNSPLPQPAWARHSYAQSPTASEPERPRRQRRRPYEGTSTNTTETQHVKRVSGIREPAQKRARQLNEVDYIHICEEYPPIVLESLKKSNHRLHPLSSSSSSSSSDVSGTTQEVPRNSIPQGKPKVPRMAAFPFTRPMPLQSRAWTAPTSFPRQWMDEPNGDHAANAQVRYAPHMPLRNYEETIRDFKPEPSRTREQRRFRRTSRHKSGSQSSVRVVPQNDQSEDQRGYKESDSRLQDGLDSSIKPKSNVNGDRETIVESKNEQEEEKEEEEVEVPLYEPMPMPIIEEPASPKPGSEVSSSANVSLRRTSPSSPKHRTTVSPAPDTLGHLSYEPSLSSVPGDHGPI
ncbi:hypothetical protein ACN47E_001336 [Coniothyrium glycines]